MAKRKSVPISKYMALLEARLRTLKQKPTADGKRLLLADMVMDGHYAKLTRENRRDLAALSARVAALEAAVHALVEDRAVWFMRQFPD